MQVINAIRNLATTVVHCATFSWWCILEYNVYPQNWWKLGHQSSTNPEQNHSRTHSCWWKRGISETLCLVDRCSVTVEEPTPIRAGFYSQIMWRVKCNLVMEFPRHFKYILYNTLDIYSINVAESRQVCILYMKYQTIIYGIKTIYSNSNLRFNSIMLPKLLVNVNFFIIMTITQDSINSIYSWSITTASYFRSQS